MAAYTLVRSNQLQLLTNLKIYKNYYSFKKGRVSQCQTLLRCLPHNFYRIASSIYFFSTPFSDWISPDKIQSSENNTNQNLFLGPSIFAPVLVFHSIRDAHLFCVIANVNGYTYFCLPHKKQLHSQSLVPYKYPLNQQCVKDF